MSFLSRSPLYVLFTKTDSHHYLLGAKEPKIVKSVKEDKSCCFWLQSTMIHSLSMSHGSLNEVGGEKEHNGGE